MPEIRRILVANRGEIAVRVMRTCRDLGIETVAVFSEADRMAPHVLAADHAVPLGPPPPQESYLHIEKILAACRRSGADAVHPGYGFLSENDRFADACINSGIEFIGPPGEAMRVMGSKTRARSTMMAANVPVVPGENGPEGRGFPSAAAGRIAAERVGFPVLIKPAEGGGGKGMHFVESVDRFEAAFESARREAKGAFGDDSLYVEKAIVRARHVEIQVFADRFGQVVHLGERDCSVQRRHQKVIEETPSPAVDTALRARMGRAAVQAARACGYVGAGTVEFLLGADGNYYFLEMNTRLQVEHPVTEMIYAVDLVAWQIAVARGEPLPLGQEELDARRRGAAIECRVYAEDPVRFLPSPGRITHLRTPAGPNVRDDSGAYEGMEIPVHYDPLISKLVVWGESRTEALARMRRALGEYAVRGIETNLRFHRRVLREREFLAGRYDTGYVERMPELRADTTELTPELEIGLAAAAIRRALGEGAGRPAHHTAATAASPQPSAWRRSTVRL
jgi:acetyl-CoA carboxylase biotin carboxylase subunit